MEQDYHYNGALTYEDINARLDKDIFIRPILDREKQINAIGVDFRLGYNFLVNIQGREAYMNASRNNVPGDVSSSFSYFFQETRRQLGETFILHPRQTILATSLEYIKLPNDLFLMLYMRSSYSRLGLTISTVVQPGYCGCISLELSNNGITPINLTIGARLFQGLLLPAANQTNYFTKSRKYACQVRPEPSAAVSDKDLEILSTLWKEANHLK
ncbi:dCTP deaminase [Spirosoma sp. KNUC1025]|uniref:dCTP deaminase n=1 Tax=Spirosoma sp. KNUC1025 TaxID=2894082 RepID=UPI00386C9329|nr:dCTP deaminase [Spirosoma sp. KNUC1025]